MNTNFNLYKIHIVQCCCYILLLVISVMYLYSIQHIKEIRAELFDKKNTKIEKNKIRLDFFCFSIVQM